MFQTDLVEVTIADSIAWVRINRPDSLNALNVDVLHALREAFYGLQAMCRGERAYADCRAVVVCSTGEKAFVAGADIKLMQAASAVEISNFIALGQEVMREVERTPLPVIAMVQGFAFGGGMELALACDLIAVSDKAKLGQPEINLGLIPGFGGTQRLTARAGVGTAKRFIFLGESFGAEDSLRLGVVDYVFPQDELEQKTRLIAQGLASKSPVAMAAAKASIDAFSETQKLAGLSREVEAFVHLFGSNDAREGLAAFVEKRSPKFPGS